MNFLKELDKIDVKDLKNIDLTQVRSTLQSRLEITISLLVVVGTLFAVVYMTGNRKKETDRLSVKINELKQKLDVMKEQEGIQKNYTDFVKKFPQSIPTDQLIDKISALASNHNIQIQSFSPAEETKGDFWQLANLNINITGRNYKKIILFIQEIENLPYAIQIQKWSGKSKEGNVRNLNRGTSSEDIIEVNIKIGSITLKK